MHNDPTRKMAWAIFAAGAFGTARLDPKLAADKADELLIEFDARFICEDCKGQNPECETCNGTGDRK